MRSNSIHLEVVSKLIYAFFFIFIAIFFIGGSVNYKGSVSIYILFTLVANLTLLFGYLSKSFFALYIGIYLWLGFWVKFSYRVWRLESRFSDPVGFFDYSPNSFDEVLLISSVGLSGLLSIFFIKWRHLEKNKSNSEKSNSFNRCAPNFYKANRKKILICFIFFSIVIAVLNTIHGVYQRGEPTHIDLPWWQAGIFKWLLTFGLASFSAFLIDCEILLSGKKINLVIFSAMLEGFSSSISMLSRAMVINFFSLIMGGFRSVKVLVTRKIVFWGAVHFISFLALWYLSFNVVTNLRFDSVLNGLGIVTNGFWGQQLSESQSPPPPPPFQRTFFLDRWVGVEGVMAISSLKKNDWDIFLEACVEKYDEHKISFYDDLLPDSPYKNTDFSKHHFISLPGVIAFFYYPGSIYFLFLSMALIAILFILFEDLMINFMMGNLVNVSLFSGVIAYRLSNFGYVPGQSYLILAALILNIILIRFLTVNNNE